MIISKKKWIIVVKLSTTQYYWIDVHNTADVHNTGDVHNTTEVHKCFLSLRTNLFNQKTVKHN